MFRGTVCALAAALGVAWLAAGTPAHAAGARVQAKQECRELLRDKGYRGVDVDRAKRTGGDRVRVEADARQHGSGHDVSCVYNSETGKAHIRK